MSNFSVSCLFFFRRVKIDNFDQIVDPDKGMALFTTVSPDKRYNAICHKCSNKADGVHSHHHRTLRDLNFGNNLGFIIYNYRKVTCPNCGQTRVEDLGIIRDPKGPRVTERMTKYIHELCCLMPIDQVAKHLNLDWKTVKEIDKRFLEEKFSETDYTNSGYIAIDEISVGKYNKYRTVVLDFIDNWSVRNIWSTSFFVMIGAILALIIFHNYKEGTFSKKVAEQES
jgi:transposase